jgi:argininosuccinate lyase
MSKDPATNALVDKMVDEQAEQLRATFAKKHGELTQMTETLRKTIEQLRTQGFKTHEPLWNACLYLNIASHDLSLLVQDLSMKRDDWHRRFMARHLALLLYETTEDIRSLLGKTFRDALNRLGLLTRFEPRLKNARKPLDEFWDHHQAALKQIRIVSAAHRDHDALTTLSVIQSIDVHDFADLGMAFNNVLNGIAAALQQILTASSSVMPPELQTNGT